MAVKILSVDDESDLELLLTQYFRRKIRKGEYEFSFAHNGLEALAMLLKNKDYDIILSDINMPEMDGLTLLYQHARDGRTHVAHKGQRDAQSRPQMHHGVCLW